MKPGRRFWPCRSFRATRKRLPLPSWSRGPRRIAANIAKLPDLLGRIKADTEARRPLATFIALAALPYSLAGAVFPGRPIESCRA